MPIDYKKYPKNWKEIRAKIMGRASRISTNFDKFGHESRCELCFVENHKPHWLTNSRVVLTIHHINFNPQDNRDCNLIALCQRCHIKLDAGEKARRRELKKNGGNKLLTK